MPSGSLHILVSSLMVAGGAAVLAQGNPDTPPGRIAAGAVPDPMVAVGEARALREAGKPGHGAALRLAAATLARAGNLPQAIDVLDEVVRSPESPFDVMEALRMKGQYARGLGRAAEALRAFKRMLDVVDEEPSLQRFAISYASGVQQYATLLAAGGLFAEAAAAHERIFQLPAGAVDEFIRVGALITSVNYYTRAGDADGAVATIDRLMAESPRFRREDDRAIGLLVHRAELRDPTKAGDGYVAALRAIWEDPALAAMPGRVEVGERLAAALRLRGSVGESIDAAAAALDLAEHLIAELRAEDPADARLAGLARSRASLLATLSAADSDGRPDLAARALRGLIEISTDEAEREDLRWRLERIR